MTCPDYSDYQSQNVVSCVLVRTPVSIPNDAGRYERFGHWILHGVYDRSVADRHTIDPDRFAYVDNAKEDWTHLLVLQSNWEAPEAEGRLQWHDDISLQFVFESARQRRLHPHLPRLAGSIPNLVGCTRRTGDALEVVKCALPAEESRRLLAGIQQVIKISTCPFPVLENLGGVSYFAKTLLVDYCGRTAVCKLFRPGYEHHFETELNGLKAAASAGIAPDLLEVGPTWLVMEYMDKFGKLRTTRSGMLLLEDACAALFALERLHNLGYTHFDFNPTNILRDQNGAVKLIDFEHVFPYEHSIPSFAEHPFFSGTSFFQGNDIHYSVQNAARRRRYEKRGPLATYTSAWWPRLGVPHTELQGKPTWRSKIRRRVFAVRRIIKASTKRAKTYAKLAIRGGMPFMGSGRRGGRLYRRADAHPESAG